ncbi:MAG: phosphonate metabolism protein PhnP [Gammaproteobacteria bacterium]
MQLELLGTGSAGGMPLFGCPCAACEQARQNPKLSRESACARISHGEQSILIDAGLSDLHRRYGSADLSHMLLTHFHMDHVQGLFPLRWGRDAKIKVIGPDDPKGADDLFKHPGILDFSTKAHAFEPFPLAGMTITPLPLNHSRPTLGYVFEADGQRMAYLTDTLGLPEGTEDWLKMHPCDILVVDCSFPPTPSPRNHNDLGEALRIIEISRAKQGVLTHISDRMALWLLEHEAELPGHVRAAHDGMLLRPADAA